MRKIFLCGNRLMTQTLQLILSPLQSSWSEYINEQICQRLNIHYLPIYHRIIRRSLDCRQKDIKVLLTIEATTDVKDFEIHNYIKPAYQQVGNSEKQIIIVGAGPAGLFAALTAIEKGIKPIIIERGKDVSSRKRDIAILNRNEGINTESNYCFGEGGAGTFSDGKLFSRSKKRGEMQRVMEIFHHFGANDSILYETHAHIGSDKLPEIIKRIRQTILDAGGEIHFSEKMISLVRRGKKISGIQTATNTYYANAVILAIGHSARDTYRMLQQEGIVLQPKGFAMGVRAEHPQSLINRLVYHHSGDELTELVNLLGNASYSLVTQVAERGVYSFCMCPGGHIVPAGQTEGVCVVNGMSSSLRNSPYANSGIVVEIRPEDVGGDTLNAQQVLEHLAFDNGMKPNIAPAQRLKDFTLGKTSATLPATSYLPGTVSSRLDLWLPTYIGKRLQQGFIDFDKKYKGFLTNDAVILGVESRTSSPLRILRDADTYCCVNNEGLYACGEGSGYAGGITSSALDGINLIKRLRL